MFKRKLISKKLYKRYPQVCLKLGLIFSEPMLEFLIDIDGIEEESINAVKIIITHGISSYYNYRDGYTYHCQINKSILISQELYYFNQEWRRKVKFQYLKDIAQKEKKVMLFPKEFIIKGSTFQQNIFNLSQRKNYKKNDFLNNQDKWKSSNLELSNTEKLSNNKSTKTKKNHELKISDEIAFEKHLQLQFDDAINIRSNVLLEEVLTDPVCYEIFEEKILIFNTGQSINRSSLENMTKKINPFTRECVLEGDYTENLLAERIAEIFKLSPENPDWEKINKLLYCPYTKKLLTMPILVKGQTIQFDGTEEEYNKQNFRNLLIRDLVEKLTTAPKCQNKLIKVPELKI